MFGFWTHVVLVPLCIGFGYFLKYFVDNMLVLEEQVRRLKTPGVRYSPSYQPPQALKEIKLPADPSKLAQLKSSIKATNETGI